MKSACDFFRTLASEPTEIEFAARFFTQFDPNSPDLIREVSPNPFAPPRFEPEWRSSDVVGLARAIYEQRAFDQMPILADALQDAGCDNDDILNHCRSASTHVRGCWALDLCLGLE